MEFIRRMKPADQLAAGIFGLLAFYALARGTAHTILAGAAFVLMMLGAMPRRVGLAFLVGALVIALVQPPRLPDGEGFEDGAVEKKEEESEETDPKKELTMEGEEAEEETEKEVKPKAKKEEKEKFATQATKPVLPNNRDRKEMLQLGKPYKLPSESDDKGYHLDAGTTFLNAYKALKPDQIAAMTRDTQELLATQKSLMTMLDSFGPLMKDMNKITGFFNGMN
jgi:hypothetical protein